MSIVIFPKCRMLISMSLSKNIDHRTKCCSAAQTECLNKNQIIIRSRMIHTRFAEIVGYFGGKIMTNPSKRH